VINCDGHRQEHVGYLRLGVGMARKAGLTKADVINTLPFRGLLKELAKKRNRT
jgi:histidinol phosphatase-like PHP family hydrolase